MTKPRLVIIGNGMASGRLLTELSNRAPGHYAITVFGDEPLPSYNRIMLSPVLAGEQEANSLYLHTSDWYSERAIAVYCGERISRIDREQRQVISVSGRVTPYDQLVIATGSTPTLPALPSEQLGLHGVMPFRTLADVSDITEQATQTEHAVVIGGGLLGLEAAYGLRKRGCRVTVLHRGPWLMNRQLDETAATLLAEELRQRGIELRLQTEVASFNGDHRLHGISLDDDNELNCQLAVIAIGITPNIDLARQAGLICDRGIQVDNHLRSSDPTIYALGECCQFKQQTFGLVEPIWQQVDVLVDQLAGNGERRYDTRPIATKLKVSGIDLFSAGEFNTGPGHEVQEYHSPVDSQYRKLLFLNERLVGAVLYGDVADGNDYLTLIEQGTDIQALRPWLMFGVEFAREQAERFNPVPHSNRPDTQTEQSASARVPAFATGATL